MCCMGFNASVHIRNNMASRSESKTSQSQIVQCEWVFSEDHLDQHNNRLFVPMATRCVVPGHIYHSLFQASMMYLFL